jgi:lactoylglutathione lyase
VSDGEEVEHLSRLWMWGTNVATMRVLHTALRVEDIERSLRFYVDGVGMKVIERINIAPRRVRVVFLGFEGDDYRAGGFLELVQHLDHEGGYDHGTAFHRVSFGVADTRAVVAEPKRLGRRSSYLRPVKATAHGSPSSRIPMDTRSSSSRPSVKTPTANQRGEVLWRQRWISGSGCGCGGRTSTSLGSCMSPCA